MPSSLDSDEEMSESSEEDIGVSCLGGLCQLGAPNFGSEKREIR